MLFISFGFVGGCSDAQVAGTAEQRDLGYAPLAPGLEFRVSPGTIADASAGSVTARASAPLPRLNLRAGPDEHDPVSVTLSNIYRDAEIRVRQVSPLTSEDMSDCPDDADDAAIVCSESPDDPACRAPTIERDPSSRAQLEFELSLPPCRQASWGVEPPEEVASEPLRLAVIGRTESPTRLGRALDRATADEPDLVVLLGDNAEHASLNGLRALELALRQADYPAVVLPGEDEIVEGSRSQFLETFGPFDFRFGLKDIHLVAFFSAEAELGEDGVDRLQGTLDRLSDERPKLFFTHTPPIDPVGPRDEGLESQIQGARTLSVLAEHNVDALFTGHINDAHSDQINGVQTHLTSVERADEYLWVVVDGDDVSVEHRGL